MTALTASFLFIVSFVGTKFCGLDRTISLFRSIGKIQRHTPLRRSSRSLEQLRKQIQRGYAFLPLPIQCLDQAIVSWYLLNLNNYPASLKIGVSLAPFYSHAWTETGKEIFGDIARLADFHVVAEYPSFIA